MIPEPDNDEDVSSGRPGPFRGLLIGTVLGLLLWLMLGLLAWWLLH